MRPLTAGKARSASTHALTKKPMKPSPTPCFFWKASLYFARSSITRDRSASLNVVRMAALLCAASSRSAMRWRTGDIGWGVPRAPVARGGGGRLSSLPFRGGRLGNRPPVRRRRRGLTPQVLQQVALGDHAARRRRHLAHVEALGLDQHARRRRQAPLAGGRAGGRRVRGVGGR